MEAYVPPDQRHQPPPATLFVGKPFGMVVNEQGVMFDMVAILLHFPTTTITWVQDQMPPVDSLFQKLRDCVATHRQSPLLHPSWVGPRPVVDVFEGCLPRLPIMSFREYCNLVGQDQMMFQLGHEWDFDAEQDVVDSGDGVEAGEREGEVDGTVRVLWFYLHFILYLSMTYQVVYK
jgi:hypothetical protein